ncbi:MAG: hypothetical protein ACRECO_22250 [Xanthobacteraceae bacterium]
MSRIRCLTRAAALQARRSLACAAVLAISASLNLFAASGMAQTPGFTPRMEDPNEFPEGAGRDDAFYSCTACHNFKLVAQQGQSREQWDETIEIMIKRHNMPPLDPKQRNAVLDYLAATFPPRKAPGGWQNPFAGQ